MKRLILMRHGKSSLAEAGQPDLDRALSARGQRDAPAVGAWLAARQFIPEMALVSTAVRTQETWSLLGQAFADVRLSFRADLYHAEPDILMRAVRNAETPGADGTILMLGHQPGIGAFARRLLSVPPDEPAFAKYPTLATAVIGFEVEDWSAVTWGNGRLIAFVTPAAAR